MPGHLRLKTSQALSYCPLRPAPSPIRRLGAIFSNKEVRNAGKELAVDLLPAFPHSSFNPSRAYWRRVCIRIELPQGGDRDRLADREIPAQAESSAELRAITGTRQIHRMRRMAGAGGEDQADGGHSERHQAGGDGFDS